VAIAAREALLAGGLIFGAVNPGGGVLERGEFEADDFFDCGSFQNFVATMDGAKFAGVLLPAGRDKLSVFVQPGFIAGFLAGVLPRRARDAPGSGSALAKTNHRS
jgi:hypothetical protein